MQVLLTMDIRSPKGTLVTVIHDNGGIVNGTEDDKNLAALYLNLDKVYTVDHTDVQDWVTRVYLTEVPGIAFNSVNFKEV